MEQELVGADKWTSSFTSTIWPTMGLGGMAQWGLDDGRVTMNARRVVELFGTMAASMAGLTRIMLWSLS